METLSETTKTHAYAGSNWIETSTGKKPSALGVKVADLLGEVFAGIYHLNHISAVDWTDENFISVPMTWPLATYDSPDLTRLVVLAHDYCLRLEIRPSVIELTDESGATYGDVEGDDLGTTFDCPALELCFSPRAREGDLLSRHPTLEEAVASVRENR